MTHPETRMFHQGGSAYPAGLDPAGSSL